MCVCVCVCCFRFVEEEGVSDAGEDGKKEEDRLAISQFERAHPLSENAGRARK